MHRALLAMSAFVALIGAACLGDRNGAVAERENLRTGTAERSRIGVDQKQNDPCAQQGAWVCSREADWVRRVLLVAGYTNVNSTGSAMIARGRRGSFFIWTTGAARPIRETANPAKMFPRLADVPIYGDHGRLVWRAQRLNVWLERGPGGDATLPRAGRLATLVLTTQLLPLTRSAVELMPTPRAALRECRRSELMRPACPSRVPRVPIRRIEAGLYRDFPNRGAQAFNLQRGGEYPGKPELNRPPGMLHLVILAGPLASPPYGITNETRIRDGVMRETRERGLLVGSLRWGSRRGTLVLAPPYGLGGIEGNHLIFRWRKGKDEYALSLHGWEPFRETVSTLRRVIESLPQPERPREAGASPVG